MPRGHVYRCGSNTLPAIAEKTSLSRRGERRGKRRDPVARFGHVDDDTPTARPRLAFFDPRARPGERVRWRYLSGVRATAADQARHLFNPSRDGAGQLTRSDRVTGRRAFSVRPGFITDSRTRGLFFGDLANTGRAQTARSRAPNARARGNDGAASNRVKGERERERELERTRETQLK